MKILIIGFGNIGKQHFLALKNLNHQISILSSSAKEDEYEKIQIYRSLKECNLNTFDLFIIANITTEHFKTLKTLDELVKDKIILVEKPLFEKTLEFKSFKNKIFVAYLLRFHPVILTLKELLKDEKIYFANFVCNSYLPHWRTLDYKKNYSAKKELGGGVLLDLSHEIDLAFFLFGDLELEYSQNAKISELCITSDDFAFLALKNSQETKIYIELDYFSKFNKREINIHTLEKSLKADLIHNKIEIYHKDKSRECLNFKNDTIKTLQNLQKAVFQNDKQLCDIKQALKVLEICDEVRKQNG
ncbi:TPA: L-glutamine-D-fructose-6-phosphate isomerase subunit [Campylobacter jejuni]|nr:L-glutamine-D-fructose-6-phosphate isomerase subunit [Campylobacter jejuni]HDZ5094519.1 L-glutamine-D-fructose-6-phosphate isomerase subunit [Campylobacter jejuni]HDZ5096048.1 L-glutamine-D-fructose-6-phosphate isomerase subunit [Campylobacter jejuni]HDZ5099514.1 L-glutamine-D-fructose-6-phosphate isomerase subunit [Campylobacter jejuni]HDZ5102878.1 L-glutamine-D-fructose-6-phosphate isomerase subunit [Campylobacter jejuni]